MELGILEPVGGGEGAIIGPGGLGLLGDQVAICDQANGRWLLLDASGTATSLPIDAGGPTVATVRDGIGWWTPVSGTDIAGLDLRTGERVPSIAADVEIYALSATSTGFKLGTPGGDVDITVEPAPPAGLGRIVESGAGPRQLRLEGSDGSVTAWILDETIRWTPLLAYEVGNDEVIIVLYTPEQDSLVAARLTPDGVTGAFAFPDRQYYEGFGTNIVGLDPTGLAVLTADAPPDGIELNVYDLP